MSDDRKLLELERRTDAMARRLDRLEAEVARGGSVAVTLRAPERPAPPRPLPPPAAPERPAPDTAVAGPEVAAPPPPKRPPASPARPAPRTQAPGQSLEDLLAGRVLAWVGGVAVLLGVVFLLAMAVTNGWIGEAERTLAAGAASLGLVALGIRLHDRRGRTDASLAATATGIAGAFTTVVVATQVYDLLPATAGLALAGLVGAAATALAIRWRAPGIGALGIVGALLAPALTGAPLDAGTLAFLFLAGLSAAGVLLWQRWDWLALASFAVATPQWVAYLLDATPSVPGTVAVLGLFGALGVLSAIGFELRVPATELRASSSFLLVLNAAVLALAGWVALDAGGDRTAADLWLAALAVIHVVVGVVSGRLPRVSREIGLLVLALGVALADVAFGLIANGPLLAAGWAASGVGFAWLARRARQDPTGQGVALLGLGSHTGLALLHALVHDAQPGLLLDGRVDAAGLIALAAVASGCLVSARLAAEGREDLRAALDILGLAVAAYLAAVALDGAELAAVWSLQAAALGQVARRTRDDVAAWAAVSHLGAALIHVVAYEATPDALLVGLDDPRNAVIGLLSVSAAALWLGSRRIGAPDWAPKLYGTAAAALLYLASAALVTPFQPGGADADPLFALGVREQGQVLVSALWSVVGVAAVVVGLRRDLRAVRLAGLGLLFVTVGKVFLYDLAALTSLYRVVSFVALGLLLLAAAFVWQRLRPRPLPDLRETPPAVR